jgi:hypothetical protein
MHKCLCDKVTGDKVTFRSPEVGCFLVIICCRLSVIISVFWKTLQDSCCMHSDVLKNSTKMESSNVVCIPELLTAR